jgi:hypothetical protein
LFHVTSYSVTHQNLAFALSGLGLGCALADTALHRRTLFTVTLFLFPFLIFTNEAMSLYVRSLHSSRSSSQLPTELWVEIFTQVFLVSFFAALFALLHQCPATPLVPLVTILCFLTGVALASVGQLIQTGRGAGGASVAAVLRHTAGVGLLLAAACLVYESVASVTQAVFRRAVMPLGLKTSSERSGVRDRDSTVTLHG